MRTKIEIPESLYKDVKLIADKLDIPVATFIALMVSDSLNADLKVDKDNLKKKSVNKVGINLTFDEVFYQNRLVDFVTETPSYTIKDFVIDCILYQLPNFETILNTKNKKYTHDIKIAHTDTAKYSRKTKEENKPSAPLKEYLNFKSKQYGISESAIKKFYIGKQVNQIISDYEKERYFFDTPEDFI